jgi:uncharacterized protein (DUF433 family)
MDEQSQFIEHARKPGDAMDVLGRGESSRAYCTIEAVAPRGKSLVGLAQLLVTDKGLLDREARGESWVLRMNDPYILLDRGSRSMETEYVEQREGNFFVRGSRVSLDSLVYGFLDGESPETTRDNFPALTLEQVYGAIAFYLGHQEEIDAYLKKKAGAYEEARRAQTHVSADLRARVQSRGHLVQRP